MDTGLRGRTVLVPGSTSGLGLACARAFAGEGANVVVTGRRTEVAREAAAALPSAIGVGIDLTEEGAPRRLYDDAVQAFGQVDVLILNGGGPPRRTASEVDGAQLQAALRSLLISHHELVTAALPSMRERRWGRIIAVGSSGVQEPIDELALSNIGRAGLAGYLKSLANEVAADRVTVNMVLPGLIDTDRVASLDKDIAETAGKTKEQVRAASQAGIPMRRYGTPEEFAAAVVFLASQQASYITGEQLRCDGGLVRSY
jgi:3-oxoacyl-[acyl-carrier protein] reductase